MPRRFGMPSATLAHSREGGVQDAMHVDRAQFPSFPCRGLDGRIALANLGCLIRTESAYGIQRVTQMQGREERFFD